MPTAVIVDAVRTPGGKRNGKLKNWHAVDLASEALRALVTRNNLDPSLVDDVIMGCVSQVGEQAFNVGRSAVLAAGWPESVPATTIDRQCGSSQQALHFAAQGVMSGAYDVGVAAGVELMTSDEGRRPDSSVEALANLKPAFKEGGKVTAGNSSQITDGASAVLIMSEEKALELGYTPRARFHAFALAGVDPVTMLTGPIPATRKILQRAGLTLDNMDMVEINEAFASVVLAWQKELGADLAKVNVNGGTIALGHPLGASGAKLCATLLNELERTHGRYGLLTMCEGGGLANATIIERLG